MYVSLPRAAWNHVISEFNPLKGVRCVSDVEALTVQIDATSWYVYSRTSVHLFVCAACSVK